MPPSQSFCHAEAARLIRIRRLRFTNSSRRDAVRWCRSSAWRYGREGISRACRGLSLGTGRYSPLMAVARIAPLSEIAVAASSTRSTGAPVTRVLRSMMPWLRVQIMAAVRRAGSLAPISIRPVSRTSRSVRGRSRRLPSRSPLRRETSQTNQGCRIDAADALCDARSI